MLVIGCQTWTSPLQAFLQSFVFFPFHRVFIGSVHLFLFICVFLLCLSERHAGRWRAKCLQQHGWARPEPGTQTSTWLSPMHGRDSGSCSLLGIGSRDKTGTLALQYTVRVPAKVWLCWPPAPWPPLLQFWCWYSYAKCF